MSTIADLVIGVRADTSGAEKDIKSFGSKVGGGFKSALLPATAALGALGVIGKAAFTNLQDGARNAKQTQQVIKTTGDASNVTAKHVDTLAMSLRTKAGVDDDVVHSGENMLLTFTNVRNEVGKGNNVFDQATGLALDMSHALGQDMKSSAMQLGKALNDPVKGITALQRVGVSFTAEQREQIKTLVQGKSALQALTGMGITPNAAAQKALAAATKAGLTPAQALQKAHVTLTAAQLKLFKTATEGGHTLAAQKIIMHELGREFGGAATNIDPTQRALANMKLNAIDLASSLLTNLMPAIQVMIGALTSATAFMQDHQRVTKIVVGVIAALALGIVAVNIGMKIYAAGAAVVKAATTAWTAAQWLLNAALDGNPIALVIIGLVALGAAFVVLWTKSETFRNIVRTTWADIKTVISATVNFVQGLWQRFGGQIEAVARTAFGIVKSVINNDLGVIRGVITLITGLIHGDWSKAWEGIKQIVSNTVGVIPRLIAKFGPQIAAAAISLGKGIADGIIHGAEHLAGDLFDKLKGSVGGAIKKVKSVFGIFSPSQITKNEIGAPLGQGVVMGFLLGTANLPAKMSDSIRKALEAAKQTIDSERASFQTAFSGITSIAGSAFDAIAGATKTKSEKLLDQLVSKHDTEAFKQNLADAKQAAMQTKADLTTFMADPTEGGTLTPDQAGAKYAQLNAAIVTAQKQVDDLLYQQHVAALQKKAAAERKELDASNAVRKLNFESQLSSLESHLTKEGAKAGDATKAILKLLAAFGINFKSVGADMGIAWVQGLKDAMEEAAGKSGDLNGTIKKAADGVNVPKHRAAGGPVKAGHPYIVGEIGQELFVPDHNGAIVPNHALGGGAGGPDGDVILVCDGDVIGSIARKHLNRVGVRNARLAISS